MARTGDLGVASGMLRSLSRNFTLRMSQVEHKRELSTSEQNQPAEPDYIRPTNEGK